MSTIEKALIVAFALAYVLGFGALASWILPVYPRLKWNLELFTILLGCVPFAVFFLARLIARFVDQRPFVR